MTTRIEQIEQRLAKCAPWPWKISNYRPWRIIKRDPKESTYEVGDDKFPAVAEAFDSDIGQFVSNAPADIVALLKVARAANKVLDGGTDYLLCIPNDSPQLTQNMDDLAKALAELNQEEPASLKAIATEKEKSK